MLYIKNNMTKSHNSCKTCSIAKTKLYSHLHVMLVIVYGYEQNPSWGVGGVAHTGFRDVRMYVSANLNPPTIVLGGGHNILTN